MEWPCSGHVKKYLRGSDLPIKKTKNSSLTFNEKCFYWNVYIITIMYECCLLNESSYKNLFIITFNLKRFDLPISIQKFCDLTFDNKSVYRSSYEKCIYTTAPIITQN